MTKYLILGKSGAGSLIPEFLFTELKITYDIQFVSKEELVKSTSKGYNPLGKIPVLILPDGTEIFESLAIVNYITTNYPGLSPTKESTDYFQYWRMLSLLSSTLYSGYHRQHHANDYVNEIGFTSLKEKALQEQSIIYDYIEQNLNPYLCGKIITAADFYLYTLTRWDFDKTKLRLGRPNLSIFLENLRSRKSVDKVLSQQPPKPKIRV